MDSIDKRVSFVLMLQILKLIQESGANDQEARCALMAAEAMRPELDLRTKATIAIQS